MCVFICLFSLQGNGKLKPMPLKMFPFANRETGSFCHTGAWSEKRPFGKSAHASLSRSSALCISFILMWGTFIPRGPVSLSCCFIHPGGLHLSVPSGQGTIWDSLLNISPGGYNFQTRHLIAGVKQQTCTHCPHSPNVSPLASAQ